MPRKPVTWETLRTLMEAQPPGVGALATWQAIFDTLEVTRLLWARRDTGDGYRIDALGILPAVLVLPVGWRAALPPLDAGPWLIPTSTAEDP